MALDNMTIAHRYGKALFDLALEQAALSDVCAELNELKKVLKAEPQLVLFMTSPQISGAQKLAMLETLKNGASQLTVNLLTMLHDYGRVANLEAIIDEFNRLNDEFEKTVRATVTTAVKLDETQKQKLAAAFANVVGAKKVIIEQVVDESIIGGVILKANSNIYDGSIKSKLERIKRLLLK